jgi:hypothetical protein
MMSFPTVREKINDPKTLMALMSAQDVEVAGLLKKKRKLRRRIKNKQNMTESITLDWKSKHLPSRNKDFRHLEYRR